MVNFEQISNIAHSVPIADFELVNVNWEVPIEIHIYIEKGTIVFM